MQIGEKMGKRRRRPQTDQTKVKNTGKKTVVLLASVIIAVIISLLILSQYILTSQEGHKPFIDDGQNDGGNVAAVKVINLKASRFEYSPSIITVNKGDKVKIIMDNADITHGINIPELGISGNDVIEFTAGTTGEFTWYCNNYLCNIIRNPITICSIRRNLYIFKRN